MVTTSPLELPSRPAAPAEQPAELARIYADHGAFVRRALRYLGAREADLDDACQEVFLVVHRRLPEFEGRSSVRTWVYGICLRVAADFRKRAHVRYEQPSPEPPEPAVESEVERNDARRILLSLLSELDDDARTIVVLHRVEELSMSEVAELLGCPVQTAYTRYYAADKELRRLARRSLLPRRSHGS